MRTTGIRLIADFVAYKREMREAKRETKDFKDQVEGLDGSGRRAGASLDKAGQIVQRVGRDFGSAGQSGQRMAAGLDNVGRSAGRVRTELTNVGKVSKHELDQMRQHVAEVDRQIATTHRNLASLGAVIARGGGDPAIVKTFNAQKGQLNLLKDIRKFLPNPDEAEKAGEKMGKSVFIGFMRISRAVAVPLGAVVAGAAIVAVPLLAAAIGGAVVGAAGVGGVIGGLLLASRDPRVQAAATDLARSLDQRLRKASTGFVDETLAALGRITGAIKTINLESMLGNAARFVEPLERGITLAVQRIAVGLQMVLRNGGPVIDQLARGIAHLGEAVGDMFTMFAEHTPEVTLGMRILFDVVEGALRYITGVIGVLMDVFGFFVKIGVYGQQAQVEYLALEASMKKSTEATRAQNLATDGVSKALSFLAGSEADAAANADLLAAAQGKVKTAQDALETSLQQLTVGGGHATLAMRTLKTASDNLFGAAIAGVEANEAYAASWDGLSSSVKENGRSLTMNTTAGRANRDALEALLIKSNELYLADIGVGVATDTARRKHEARTTAVKEEARRLHLNKEETQKLIDTYGRIPPKKITELLLSGVTAVANSLDRLYRMQRALATGKPFNSLGFSLATVALEGSRALRKASGGPIVGPGTGTSDSVPVMASRGEHMLTAAEVTKAGGHGAIHAWRRSIMDGSGLPGYARGGAIAPVDESRRWPFVINVKNTDIPSEAEVLSKVTPAVPRGQTLAFMVRVVKAAFPGLGLISGYRPGARTLSGAQSYHALHRASDWPASKPLAEWINLHYKARTKELITPWNSLNIHNGQRHTYTGAVYRQHNFAGGNAHDHWAMANGGIIREPVFGVGASGDTYSFAERGPELVTSMGGAGITVNITFTGPVGSQAELDNWLTKSVDRLKSRARV